MEDLEIKLREGEWNLEMPIKFSELTEVIGNAVEA